VIPRVSDSGLASRCEDVPWTLSIFWYRGFVSDVTEAGSLFVIKWKSRNVEKIQSGKGEVKFLCLMEFHSTKTYWGCGGIIPRILKLLTR
jgi:hypothetical protein